MGRKRFRFKLQSVLEIKVKMEDEEKKKLADLVQLQAREEQVLQHLQHTRQQRILEFKEKQGTGGIDVTELQMYAYTIEKLKNDIINQQLRLREIAIKVEEQRQALIKATQEKKIYEKLKEKQQQVFTDEEEYEEKKLIDELATIKFAREKI
ncbi:MAG: flagellar export protein FliJ [Candidatus Eremiobacteraeota bacterium]|nr:flagellar export protein FliJ [Candidatus Eremiobacteraeota bacterium]